MSTNTPSIKVKVNNSYGRTFKTQIGIMQGDCLSAILFIFYLSQALKQEPKSKISSDCIITPKYADDITYITTNKESHENFKKVIPIMLQNSDLHYSSLWACGVVVSMFDFHRSDRGSNPGQGGEFS